MRHHKEVHPAAAAGTGLCPTGRTSAKIRDGIAAWMLGTYVLYLHAMFWIQIRKIWASRIWICNYLYTDPGPSAKKQKN
jgi:hypothetical protein